MPEPTETCNGGANRRRRELDALDMAITNALRRAHQALAEVGDQAAPDEVAAVRDRLKAGIQEIRVAQHIVDGWRGPEALAVEVTDV